MATQTQPAQLSDILRSLRRHWVVLVTCILVGLAVGVLAAFVIPQRYTATTSVAVYPMQTDPLGSRADQQVDMPTETQLVQSRVVAAAAAERLGPMHDLDTEAIKDAVTVDWPTDSRVLNVAFSGSGPREAVDGANEVAAAYLALRRSEAAERAARLEDATQQQVQTLGRLSSQSDLIERSRRVQAGALGTRLAELGGIVLDPGRVVGRAAMPTGPSTPGMIPLGLGGAALGLFIGIPLALTRKEPSASISSVASVVDDLAIGDRQLVLDGTKDSDRAETWGIAAFMLNIPAELPDDAPFTIMLDAQSVNGSTPPGQELVDALSKHGYSARFVDAGMVSESKINKGWPTDKKRTTWDGRIVVVDTTNVASDAQRVALAGRSDLVLLARSTDDDVDALRRLSVLLRSKDIEVDLTALFPPAKHTLLGYRE